MTGQNLHNANIDRIRALAILFVLMIHSTGYVESFTPDTLRYNLGWAIRGIVDCAVPLFVLISGYLLLPRIEDVEKFYAKRLKRVCYPFLIFSALFFAEQIARNFFRHDESIVPQLLQGGVKLLDNRINTFYWYVYMLIGLYILTPFLQRLLSVLSKKEHLYLFSILTAFLILSHWKGYYFIKNYYFDFYKYFYLYMTGYYLAKYEVRLRRLNYGTLLLLGAVSYMMILPKIAAQIALPNDICMALVLFMAINKMPGTTPSRGVADLSKYSYTIYLIHGYIIGKCLAHLQILPYPLLVVTTFVTTLVLSFLICKALDRFPRKLTQYIGF